GRTRARCSLPARRRWLLASAGHRSSETPVFGQALDQAPPPCDEGEAWPLVRIEWESLLYKRNAAGRQTFPAVQTLACRRSAVTSISICIRGSARPTEIIVAAGRTSPNQRRNTGQHCGKSAATGSM